MLLAAHFHDYFCASRAETKRIYLVQGVEGAWWFYFTYLLHAGNNLHAAHTLDVVKISSQRLLDALSFSGDIQFETMFSLWMANFSITITHVSMTRDVFCLPADSFSCLQGLETQLILVLWYRERNERLGSLFNASSQLQLMRSNWWQPSRVMQSLSSHSLTVR